MKSLSKNSKKALTLVAFLAAQAILLYLFYVNQYVILNFQWLYLNKIYIPLIAYTIEEKILDVLSPQSAVSSTQKSRAERSVPVLLYHGSIEQADATNISLEDFRKHMVALKAAGYQTTSIKDFELFMDGKKELPEKSFLLTFDDGRKDSFYPSDPILKAVGYSAVMFVITADSLDDEEHPFHLTKNELKYMLRTGRWEIESHGHDAHRTYPIDALGNAGIFLSNRLWIPELSRVEDLEEYEERIAEDMLVAKKLLENTFGITVRSFAYPFGDYGQGSINVHGAEQIVKKWTDSIYRFTYREVGLLHAIRNYPNPNTTMIDRIDVKPDWTAEYLVSLLENSKDKDLPYEDTFVRNRGWMAWGGKVNTSNNRLILNPALETNSTGAVLDGTHLWDFYRLTAYIESSNGSAISLIGRYSEKGSLFCVFKPDGVTIEEHRSTGVTPLAQQSLDMSTQWGKDMELGMELNGMHASCLVDGRLIVTAESVSHPLMTRGRVGISQIGTGSMTVGKLRVDDLLLPSLVQSDNF